MTSNNRRGYPVYREPTKLSIRRAVPNYRRAYRRARLRERVLSNNYERQQQSLRELEMLYNGMAERATTAETALKMTQTQLQAAQLQRDEAVARHAHLHAFTDKVKGELYEEMNHGATLTARWLAGLNVIHAARTLRDELPLPAHQTDAERALGKALDALQEL